MLVVEEVVVLVVEDVVVLVVEDVVVECGGGGFAAETLATAGIIMSTETNKSATRARLSLRMFANASSPR